MLKRVKRFSVLIRGISITILGVFLQRHIIYFKELVLTAFSSTTSLSTSHSTDSFSSLISTLCSETASNALFWTHFSILQDVFWFCTLVLELNWCFLEFSLDVNGTVTSQWDGWWVVKYIDKSLHWRCTYLYCQCIYWFQVNPAILKKVIIQSNVCEERNES